MAHSGENSARVILIALVANLGIALSKFFGAWFTLSASMLAEAIHSLVDATNQGLLLMGNRASRKAPSERHPLGYGREAFFWSFIVAILLFSLGGMFAIYEGAHKLSDPSELKAPHVALLILVVSIGLETVSFWACLKEVRAQNTYPSLWTWIRKSTHSELIVIFLEDLAALLGLFIALGSLLVSWITGDSFYDAIGSIAVGVLLILVAVVLAIEIKSLLIGEAPARAAEYRETLTNLAQVTFPGGRVLKTILLQTGASEVMIACKILPGRTTQVDVLIEQINRFEREIKSRFPEVRWLFIEPDHID